MELVTKDIEVFFSDFEQIYENRHKYSIEWAYEDAQNKIDQFREEIINKKLKKKCHFCNCKINKDFKSLQMTSLVALKKQKWYSRLFSNMYNILSFLEITLSIVLVLTISKLSHTGEAMLHAGPLSFWVAITFACMKVFIERYLLQPKLEALGWKLYLNSVNSIRTMTKEFNDKATEHIKAVNKNEIVEIA